MTIAPPVHPDLALLAADSRPGGWDVGRVVVADRPGRGAVAVRVGRGLVRRLEPGPCGPVVLEARSTGTAIICEVWGPGSTPPQDADRLLAATAAWAGCDDDLTGYAACVDAHPVVAELHRRLGAHRLSRIPRIAEALGRSVLGQLVQGAEARRSTVQLAALIGQTGPCGLWTWPDARTIGTTDAWVLRRCGISLRGARALHGAAMDDARLTRCADDWSALDARLRALPGVGVWTSGETRMLLGHADAVSVGDYHLPAVIGTALTGEQRARTDWTDAEMLALLAPFAGHRGRVSRLVERGVAMGLVRSPQRRAPRAALSAHRYW
jgi:3-methyladenine DNA glycosylase/8-oxoguanine DNA glycosylase